MTTHPHIYIYLINPQTLINHTTDKLCPPGSCLEVSAAAQRNPPLQNPATCLMGPASLHNDSGSDSRCPFAGPQIVHDSGGKQTNWFASGQTVRTRLGPPLAAGRHGA